MNVTGGWRRIAIGLVAAATMLTGAPASHAATTGNALCTANGRTAQESSNVMVTDLVCSGDDQLAGAYHLNFRDLGNGSGVVDGVGPNNSQITGNFSLLPLCVRVYGGWYCYTVSLTICFQGYCYTVSATICYFVPVSGEVCVWAKYTTYTGNGVLRNDNAIANQRALKQQRQRAIA